MKWIITFKKQGIRFTSSVARASFLDFMKKNPGMKFRLEPYEKKTLEQLGFYFKAVIPAFAEWHEAHDHKNPDDLLNVHELLKLEYNGHVIIGFDGKSVKVGQSTSPLSKKQYNAFLERIQRGFEENQIPFPDSKLYKLWQDTGQDEYPEYDDWLESMNIKRDGSPITI